LIIKFRLIGILITICEKIIHLKKLIIKILLINVKDYHLLEQTGKISIFDIHSMKIIYFSVL